VNVCVVGVGLIGGSIALAARERLDATVAGYDPDRTAVERALELGALDTAPATLIDALEGAELAFVCAPLGVLHEMVRETLAVAPAGCAVTDVGSTKRTILADDERFIGGHPLAGAEAAGVDHARADLFVDATWYLTPTSRTSGVLYERLHRALAALGARPAAVDAEVHDRMMAAVSHLPHVFANLLVAQAAAVLGGETLPATGPSFRDATRVAGAHPALWADILVANRDALLASVDEASRGLGELRGLLQAGDAAALAEWQQDAAARRGALLQAGALAGASSEPLRVVVPNRPGVVAELALALGGAGINISDMSLTPAPDSTRGEVALWVAQSDTERAEALIAGLGLAVA
jgi:prephenate dehydrogenase